MTQPVLQSSSPTPTPRKRRQTPWPAVLAGVLGVTLLALGAGSWGGNGETMAAEAQAVAAPAKAQPAWQTVMATAMTQPLAEENGLKKDDLLALRLD